MKRESRFTEPRDDCPHPEWWHSPDDESTEVEVTELVAGFVRALQPSFVLETGTAFGYTAHAIGTALQKNRHGRCISIDVDAKRLRAAERRCAGLPVRFYEADALEYVPPRPVNFAWVDTWNHRADELAVLQPHLAPHAVVGVHDTGPHHGVWESIRTHGGDETGLLSHFDFIRLPTPRGVAFLALR